MSERADQTAEACPETHFHGNPFRYCGMCEWMETPPPDADQRRTIRPRPGDLEKATRPHRAVESGDLCGLSMANRLMHPATSPEQGARDE